MHGKYLLCLGWMLILVACHHSQLEFVPPTPVVVSTFFVVDAPVKGIKNLAIDAADNLYFSDDYGNRIWKVTPAGQLQAFAGDGQMGHQDGAGSQARFNYPTGLTFDTKGNLWVSQFGAIRKITPDGTVSTVYGVGIGGIHSTKPAPYDTTQYLVVNGSQLFENPTALTFDKQGNLFVAEATIDSRILKITPDNQVNVFYGAPFYNNHVAYQIYGLVGNPNGLLFDGQGNLLVTDGGLFSGLIRLTPQGTGSYFSSTGYRDSPVVGTTQAPFIYTNNSIHGAAFDRSGNLLVCNDRYIQKVDPSGLVSLLAGTGKTSYVINGQLEPPDNGIGSQVRLFNAGSPVIDSKGALYFIENAGIRKLTYQ